MLCDFSELVQSRSQPKAKVTDRAAFLSLPLLSRTTVASRVNRVLATLGLQSCADQIIGTPISRGISGGG